MKNILVIGASGSLGKGVVEELKDRYSITGTYTTRPFKIDNIVSKKLDITKRKDFDVLESDYDAVFLVAGAMPAMMEGYTPQSYIDVNITGVMNVLEYCRTKKIPKLIYIQTFSDVSASFYTGIPIQDDSPRTLTLTGDHAIYAISKVAACDLIEHYHQEYGLQTIIFRIPTVYCNDNNHKYFVDGELKTKAYIKMIESIMNDRKVEVWGNPKNSKDMPYIKDFAVLIHKALENDIAQGVFNAGTGNPVSLEELVDTMIEVFSEGEAIDKKYLPDKPSQPNFTFDMQKTKEAFDYSPSFGIKKMLIDIKNTLL
ncbi:NAD-dependent epimerase/dehydratase family protein [Psychrobacter sp. DAB_AL62B]|uniref:NAD-dependent epimerase/dehydratase family protein n=1 Tax=Psychrobacter sp. DAB_AL62B TaxID=1028420 RepID=UPI00238150B0|nr:NAD(P)-dependent oxidoreductase [Psychrobacter sp. DAB_AL62B]MDE4453836.1 NAD(P)-dependent oxidoreductase [Psychrobacter sp. DAB_AL62B]